MYEIRLTALIRSDQALHDCGVVITQKMSRFHWLGDVGVSCHHGAVHSDPIAYTQQNVTLSHLCRVIINQAVGVTFIIVHMYPAAIVRPLYVS